MTYLKKKDGTTRKVDTWEHGVMTALSGQAVSFNYAPSDTATTLELVFTESVTFTYRYPKTYVVPSTGTSTGMGDVEGEIDVVTEVTNTRSP